MPQQLRVARAGLFAQAILALLGVLGVGLWAGSAMSARLAGELAFTALPAALGLALCRLMWRQGPWIFRLVLALQVWWAWGALGWLADSSWRGLTQLVLPVLIGVYITRPAVREWFTLPARERTQRPERRPLLPFSIPHFIGWRRDRGQTATEYIGLLTVVIAIIGSLVASGVTTEIGQSVTAKICRAVGTTCGNDSTGTPQADDGPDQSGNEASGDQGATGNNGTPQGQPGRERNTDSQAPEQDQDSKQEPASKKEQEENDEGCFSGLTALVSCGGDRVKNVGQGIKDAGQGIKDKFTGDYIDGPKELAKGLWNDPVGTAKNAVNGIIDEATKPFQDAKQNCHAAGGGAMGTTTCVLGWANAVVNYPTMLITSQVLDDDVKESIQKGELSRAGGQLLYNGATMALPFLKTGKILKTVGKAEKKTKPEANGKPESKNPSKPKKASTRKDIECLSKRASHSFLPGTPVLLADGTRRAIEKVEVGDHVLATDPRSGVTVARKVTNTITTEDDKDFTKLTVKLQGHPASITATDTHPFWIPDQQRWKKAGEIQRGTAVRTVAGKMLRVTDTVRYKKAQRTHDLTVADVHTFYVGIGEAEALVHNNSCKFWNRTDYKGQRVYKRDDLVKPDFVSPADKYGRSNLKRMKQGLAPIGPDGKPLNLHHMTQKHDGAIAEVTHEMHFSNYSQLHWKSGTKIPSGVDRDKFNDWKKQYWKDRAKELGS